MAEFRFTIDAYTPDTIPMGVLVEYLADFAKLLGTPNAVHFVRLEAGSAVPVIKVEKEALPKVREQIRAVKSGVGPLEAVRAYQSINTRLRRDNGSGAVVDVEDQSAEIINFPGRQEVEQSYGAIRKQGTLEGEIIRVGGVNRARVPIALQVEKDRVISYVHARKGLAEEIGKRLYRPMRLFGTGRWRRDPIGVWTLEDFGVESFEALKGDKLSSALTAIRAVSGGDWGNGALAELRDSRFDESSE